MYSCDSIDPTDKRSIQALEHKLSKLSVEFYLRRRSDGTYDPDIVKQYHAVFYCLTSLGWTGGIDFDSQLPEELMPPEYLERVAKAMQEYLSSLSQKE